jgi:hypothetical protein
LGADLSCNYLTVDPKNPPNFDTALAFLDASKADPAFIKTLRDAVDYIGHDEKECTDEDILDFHLDALKWVQSAYKDGPRNSTELHIPCPGGGYLEVFFVGQMTWGDSVEGVDQITLFTDSGMAKAAGFLTFN